MKTNPSLLLFLLTLAGCGPGHLSELISTPDLQSYSVAANKADSKFRVFRWQGMEIRVESNAIRVISETTTLLGLVPITDTYEESARPYGGIVQQQLILSVGIVPSKEGANSFRPAGLLLGEGGQSISPKVIDYLPPGVETWPCASRSIRNQNAKEVGNEKIPLVIMANEGRTKLGSVSEMQPQVFCFDFVYDLPADPSKTYELEVGQFFWADTSEKPLRISFSPKMHISPLR